MARFTGLLGLITFLGIAYACSTNRRAIKLRTVAWGLGLQIVFAFLVIKWSYGQVILHNISQVITGLLAHSADGSAMVFGPLGAPGNALAVFAFAVLPTIIFVSAFFAILYHLGIMQQIIRVVAWIMQRTMGTSGAESTNVAASIFMGQTEAPLTIRPFLAGATRSELMTIMTSGMAHVSGGIMAAYISFGINAQDLLSAVIMTAPGTILVAKMLVPETEVPATAGTVKMPPNEEHANENFIAAIARGTIDGGQLAFNVAIMLISFLALVGLLNATLLGISNMAWAHGIRTPHSLNAILGFFCAPVAWLIGIPWHEAPAIGNLLGTRAVLNEFVAYTSLGLQKSTLTPRTFSIATFALCGFANLGSIGMQIGGIGALVPNRRNDLAALGFRAMLAGTMANLMSASIVSMLIK
ncbi:NupC/NupG family nucleoside CNT transporter [Granulicella sibirica]|uniref:Nucleoside permease NupC n=1 Tax=Granulicella sibirica TaxID=2479048 RepID=A0A4Q0SX35_9BACT|nr:nucleoside transporter C-terminal domain-containing protein [Granulicella sibirica]RXH54982.1 Nucleoside permease NupC [Granulicella sibirica]